MVNGSANREIEDFFKTLTEGGEGLLELRPLAPASYRPAGRAYIDLRRPHMIAAFVKAHLQDHNFFGVATRLDGSSGTLDNCCALCALFVDIDFKSTAEAEARRLLAACPMPPSIIIQSGNGLHVYWLLREPLNLQNPEDRATAYSLLGRLAAFLHADEKAAEPAHILRVPGTLNHKYTPPRLVFIEFMDTELRYNPSEFEVLPPAPDEDKTDGGFTSHEKIYEGTRNSTLYKLARSLKAKNLSRDAILAALLAENRRKCDPPLPENDIEQIVEHAWTQADRPEFRSLDERLAHIRALPLDELKLKWTTFLDGLTAEDRQTVLKEIARLTDIGINTLKQRLKEQKEEAKRTETAGRVGDRIVIPYYPEDVCAIAHQVETAMLARITDGECVRFGDSVARVSVESLPYAHEADSDLPPTPTAQFDLMTRAKVLPLVERAVVLQVFTVHGAMHIAVPPQVLDQILVNSTQLPKVSALVTHPVVTMSGRIISAKGIDSSTRLLRYGPMMEGLRPYSQDEAREAVNDIELLFLEGFEFATPRDKTCAVALLLTAVQRKLLNMSPGFLLTAAQQSLGKTTLARRTHLILTGADAPVFTWPDDEVEAQKLLLSTLLRNPEMICFDNVGDGMTFRSPALSSAMTSATKQGRLLGHNRDAVVSTSVLFVLTGNNVELANDEVSRWVPVHLTTKEVSPHTRRFSHPDVLRHGLEIREAVLRHVIGIISGYRQSTERIPPLSRFPQWDAMVRQPLLWAGLPDIGTVFDANIEASPELGAHLALMTELYGKYGLSEAFSAADLVAIIETTFDGAILNEALLGLHAKDPTNERSVGHALSKACGRTVAVQKKGGQTLVLVLERSLVDGLSRYRVMRRGEEVGS